VTQTVGYPQQPQFIQPPTQTAAPQVQNNGASDADDFFGGGADSMSFADRSMLNVWRGGDIIAEPKKKQQRDFITKEAKFWKDGNPMWALVVTLQTQERNPQDPQDTGVRRLFIQSGLRAAVQQALDKARASMTVGGQLWVRWVGEKPNNSGGNPTKVYEAHYVPGTPGGQATEFFSQPEPDPGGQPPVQNQPPASQQGWQQPPMQNQAPKQGPPAGQQFPQQGPPNGGSPPSAPWSQTPQQVPPAGAPWGSPPAGPPQQGPPAGQQFPPQGPPTAAPWNQGPQNGPPAGPPNGQVYTGPPAVDPNNPFGPPQNAQQPQWQQQGPPNGGQQYPQQPPWQQGQ
jgi:hypothetical protein